MPEMVARGYAKGLAAGTVVLKDLKTAEQTTVPSAELMSRLSK